MLTHILLTVVMKTNKNLFSSECLFGGIPTDAVIKLLSVIDASRAVYMHTYCFSEYVARESNDAFWSFVNAVSEVASGDSEGIG